MKRIIIENVQVGVSEGGTGCGPVEGHVVAEARIRVDGKVSYYGLVEVEGTANFYSHDESRYDVEIADEYEDEFPEAEAFDDYSEFFEEFESIRQQDEAHALLLKYLVYMVRADWDDIDEMKKISIGKALGEFEIPVCDAEEDYLDECEDEE